MKLFLSLFRKQYSVSHCLQRIDKFGNVFFVFKTREFCSRLMSPCYIFLDSLHITRVCEERIARRTYLIGINTVRTLLRVTDGNPFYRTQNLFKAWDKTCIFDVKNNLCHKQSLSICVQRYRSALPLGSSKNETTTVTTCISTNAYPYHTKASYEELLQLLPHKWKLTHPESVMTKTT